MVEIAGIKLVNQHKRLLEFIIWNLMIILNKYYEYTMKTINCTVFFSVYHNYETNWIIKEDQIKIHV